MKQRSFALLSFESKKKPTRRGRFLGEMDKVVPWEALLGLIEPYYPTSGRCGRPPMPAARMLRIHFMQQCYALSDPDMHRTKKGNQWHFGMKAHIGVDMACGLVHTVTTTPANVGDVTEVGKLLHGRERMVFADAGCQGAEKRVAPKRSRRWYVAAKRGRLTAMPEGRWKEAVRHVEYLKAAIRAKVEHPFRVVKRQFGYQKVRFKGLPKNTAHVLTLFALSNLWMARRALMTSTGEVCP